MRARRAPMARRLTITTPDPVASSSDLARSLPQPSRSPPMAALVPRDFRIERTRSPSVTIRLDHTSEYRDERAAQATGSGSV
jgi:hypothetical protein